MALVVLRDLLTHQLTVPYDFRELPLLSFFARINFRTLAATEKLNALIVF